MSEADERRGPAHPDAPSKRKMTRAEYLAKNPMAYIRDRACRADSEYTSNARLVMLIIADAMKRDPSDHGNFNCFLGQEEIAARARLGRTTVKKVIRELKLARTPLIAVRQPPPFKYTTTRGHRHRSAAFTLIRHPEKYAAERDRLDASRNVVTDKPGPPAIESSAPGSPSAESPPVPVFRSRLEELVDAMKQRASRAALVSPSQIDRHAGRFVSQIRQVNILPDKIITRLIDDPDRDSFLSDPRLWSVAPFLTGGPLVRGSPDAY